ncbi:MAG: hypothetical protein NTY65_01030, partial [Planctomycetota bacterium]|nr:hypothetical protein [Planctomycetota bacterium]
MFSRSTMLFGCLLAVAVLAWTGTAQAVEYTWIGDVGATWDTSATNWSGATGTPWDLTNGPTNTASFGTVADQANLSGTVYAGGLTFNQSATVSNGGNTANSLKYATDGS